MIEISIIASPNQGFTTKTQDGFLWSVAIYESNGCMCADVSKNGVQILAGQRIVAGTPLIPYSHLVEGNFILLTMDGALPWWQEFGSSQQLYYLTAADVPVTPTLTYSATLGGA